ncbi:MAG TPA: hypothetical protein VL947_09830 [Cytophagales bacterium]|nr:hypothetical protein [Cytophagales bacterium]
MSSLIILQLSNQVSNPVDTRGIALYIVEITVMLLGAFVLGYLLRHFVNRNSTADKKQETSLEAKLQKEPTKEPRVTVAPMYTPSSSSSELSKLKSELAEANAMVASLRAKPDNSATLTSVNRELNLKITEVVSLKSEIAYLKAELENYLPKVVAPNSTTSTSTSSAQRDELKKLEGIGPKIQQILFDAGIYTYRQLAETPVDKLREILLGSGERYRMHDPSSWPKQAALAAENRWEELTQLQKNLLSDNI